MRNDNGTFAKGHCPNPAGRPKGLSLTALLRAELAEPDPMNPGATKAERLAKLAVENALKGDFRFYQEVVNRTDGKVTDKLAVASASFPDPFAHLTPNQLRMEAMRLMLGKNPGERITETDIRLYVAKLDDENASA